MNYNDCVDYIQNAALYGAKKNSLDNTIELLKRLGSPQNSLKFVHVAGTNGKGSTCAMIESVLRHSGYKTGLFTSPYLQKFTERIRIDRENIGEDQFIKIAIEVINKSKQMVEDGYSHPTFFELVTACAFIAFYEENVDIAVVEVGVGGLYDTTNIIDPELCVIANIGLDHVGVLGGTIEEIARQKAGIIKPGCPVVVYPQDNALAYTEILMAAKKNSAPVFSAKEANILVQKSGLQGQCLSLEYQGITMDIDINLLGKNQILNTATAYIACIVLKQILGYNITSYSLLEGFKNTLWPGRFEIVRHKDPLIIIDGAHNVQAAKNLANEISSLILNNKCVLLCGVMSTKDVEGIIKELAKIASKVVTTSPAPPKSLTADELREMFIGKCDEVYGTEDVEAAFNIAKELAKKNNVPLIVAGSLYLAGKVRTLVLG
jgi:dihydrofolate synthase/folylpolyglutamate synthase